MMARWKLALLVLVAAPVYPIGGSDEGRRRGSTDRWHTSTLVSNMRRDLRSRRMFLPAGMRASTTWLHCGKLR